MASAAPPAPLLPAASPAPARRLALWAVAVGVTAFAVYHFSLPDATPHDHYIRLAGSLLQGRVDLVDPPSYLEVTTYGGRAYMMNPPLPALLLLPYVAVRGAAASQAAAAHGLGGAAAAAFLLVAARLMPRTADMVWLALLGAFGTILWYLSAVGSTWYLAHVVAVTAITLGVLEALGRRRPVLIGLAVAAAFWSRLPTIMTFPFFLLATAPRWAPAGLRGWRRLDVGYVIRLAAPIAAVVALNGAYNWVRFGTFADVANVVRAGILDEPWFQRGLFHPSYIVRHLRILLLAVPPVVAHPPYLLVPWTGLAIWFTTPAFVYALRAPWRSETAAAWLGIAAVGAVDFMFGNTGVAQFGYRFATDFYPLLFLLAARGMGQRVPPLAKALILVGVAVNAWGILGTRWGWTAP